jgi:hypothetical protein
MIFCITFASTVLATLPIRTASQGGSFAFIEFKVINTPSMPLIATHTWRVFSFDQL